MGNKKTKASDQIFDLEGSMRSRQALDVNVRGPRSKTVESSRNVVRHGQNQLPINNAFDPAGL